MIAKDSAVKIAGLLALAGLYFVFSYPSPASPYSRLLYGILIAGGWLILYQHPKNDFVLTRRRLLLVLCYLAATAGFILLMVTGFNSGIAALAIFIAMMSGAFVIGVDWYLGVARSWENLFRAGGFQELSLWKQIFVIAVFLAGLFLLSGSSFITGMEPLARIGLALLGLVLAAGSLLLPLLFSAGKKGKNPRVTKRL